MLNYTNVSGDSGVLAYESGPDFIRVQFGNGSIYRYTYASAGKQNIEHMKELAAQGEGLATFISKNIKKNYAEREA